MNVLLSNPQFAAVMIALLSAIALLVRNYAVTLDTRNKTEVTQQHAADTKHTVENGTMANQIASGISLWVDSEISNPSPKLVELHKKLHER